MYHDGKAAREGGRVKQGHRGEGKRLRKPIRHILYSGPDAEHSNILTTPALH